MCAVNVCVWRVRDEGGCSGQRVLEKQYVPTNKMKRRRNVRTRALQAGQIAVVCGVCVDDCRKTSICRNTIKVDIDEIENKLIN